MKRRATAAKKPRAIKRQKTTQAIVVAELRKHTDWKYTDWGLSGANVTSAGTIASLYQNLIRGTNGQDQFVGNIVTPQAITLKFFAHTSELRNVVRVIVFQWFDDGVPTVAGILQNPAIPFGCISPILVSNKEFIKVLADQSFQMAPSAGNPITGEGVTGPHTIYIPGKRLKPTRWQASANVVQDGNLFILYISDDLLPAHPQITWYSRVTFSDK